MGRQLRRVPLDFDWPLGKVWRGFINPHYRPCPEAAKNNCHAGSTNAGKWLDAIVRLISLIGQEAASNTPAMREHMKRSGRIYPHPYLEEWAQAPRTDIPADVRRNPPRLLALDGEIAALVQGLAKGRSLDLFGLSSAEYAIQRTLIEAAGITDERWGVCKVCDGHAMDPETRDAYEAWEEEPPPVGEGWQLWETVSEGSPISPVFPTEAAFVDYLVTQGYSREAAVAFARSGWVPSGVMIVGPDGASEVHANIEAAGVMARGSAR